MMMSQFQSPRYFLLAYLEDYKMDPAAAQPLVTLSIFDDYSDDLNLTLVRCDIINRGIQDDEGRRVANLLLDSYRDDEEFDAVRDFNKKPDTFDIDDFISRQNQKWKEETCTSV
jgi:ATP synthase mitochondrial F1 complex assembly factor 1